jgi:hypothetical protein
MGILNSGSGTAAPRFYLSYDDDSTTPPSYSSSSYPWFELKEL